MIYGYARCSTNETKQDITRQKRDLRKMGAEEIYWEYESGMKHHREQLDRLLRHIQPGDTLVCTEISRITRSTSQLCKIVDLVVEKGLRVNIGGFILDCTSEKIDPMTEGMIKMMGVFAEMERNLNSERTKSGIRNARANGKQIGRPPIGAKDLSANAVAKFRLYKDGHISVTEYAKLCGICRTTAHKYIRILMDEQ